MKKISIAIFALAIATAMTPSAFADTFLFSFSSVTNNTMPSVFGGGLISASATVGGMAGEYTLSSAVLNGAVLGEEVVSPYSFTSGFVTAIGPGAEDFFTASSNDLNSTGVYIEINPSEVFHFYYNGNATYSDTAVLGSISGNVFTPNSVGGIAGTFSIVDTTAPLDTVTPEPGSLMLLGTGLLGMAFLLFRKSKPSILTLS